MPDALKQAINALEELQEDSETPKNLKTKIESTISLLQMDGESSMKASQALSHLEEATEDSNMQPFTRSQLFNIVSLLEVV